MTNILRNFLVWLPYKIWYYLGYLTWIFKFLFISFNFSYSFSIWYFRLKFAHIVASFTASFAPAFITIFFSILTYIYSSDINSLVFYNILGFNINSILLTLISFIPFLLFFGWYFLKRLPPDVHANVTIKGYNISDVIRVITYEIWKNAHQFSKNYVNKNLIKIANKIYNEGEDSIHKLSIRDRNRIEFGIRFLELLESKHQSKLQYLLEMIKQAGLQLNISPRRLCDYLFEFSPSIYELNFRKYISNWNEVLTLSKSIGVNDAEMGKRLYLLSRSIIRIHKHALKLEDNLILLIKYPDLHQNIHAIGSDLSTSSSLRYYIEGISKIVARRKEINQRLLFLYRKRIIHKGFDLHRACINFCKKELLSKSIQEIRKKTYKNLVSDSVNTDGVLEVICQENNFLKRKLTTSEISSLEGLFINFHSKTVQNRDKIAEVFSKTLIGLHSPNKINNQEILFVVQGYSKTIRQMLKKGIEILTRKNLIDNNFPKIFILKSEKEQDDMTMTRLMRFDLKSVLIHEEMYKFKDKVVCGDWNYLKAVSSASKHLYLFLGAECYEVNNNKKVVRAMHVQGINNILSEIIKVTRAKVILVAEKYKEYKNLLQIEEFYSDHLEGIDIYEEGLIHGIINEEEWV